MRTDSKAISDAFQILDNKSIEILHKSRTKAPASYDGLLLNALLARMLVIRCIRPFQVMWVPRKENSKADSLASIGTSKESGQMLNVHVLERVMSQLSNAQCGQRDLALIARLFKLT
ncbi:hypothetical protein FVE85_9154 [Porphyridium purpureum]|uniref:Uncharacterized protein n=1 Tax=Porphyridium purpureum TaxID=35688 RepID=A0A5J4YIC0_PORPP|nr:hypothetical protein FVE85_5029 [Porphyridium purpureum]KAA8492882.1 hypothetical protein FVE85_9154 [Porphyridium purpureum]|eukprot:POR3379..scf222_8